MLMLKMVMKNIRLNFMVKLLKSRVDKIGKWKDGSQMKKSFLNDQEGFFSGMASKSVIGLFLFLQIFQGRLERLDWHSIPSVLQQISEDT